MGDLNMDNLQNDFMTMQQAKLSDMPLNSNNSPQNMHIILTTRTSVPNVQGSINSNSNALVSRGRPAIINPKIKNKIAKNDRILICQIEDYISDKQN